MRTNEMKTTDNRIQNLTGRPTVEIWSAGSILGSLSLPKGPSARRGTALVLVVVLLALLAILGTSFVLTTRVERVAAKNQLAAGGMDQAVNSVIEVIKSTLAEDLWGRPEDVTATTDGTKMNAQHLLNLPADSAGNATAPLTTIVYYNEPWDAPTGYTASSPTPATFHYFDGTDWQEAPLAVDGDPWLADGTLTVNSQLTNFFNTYWSAVDQTTSWNFNLPNAVTISADADGDGNPDSVWLIQNGFFTPDANGFASINGQRKGIPVDLPIKSSDPNLTYRMAVRIVDTSGMVNVNTAWAWPGIDNAGTVEYVSAKGNSLASLMLYGTGTSYPDGSIPPNLGYVNTLPGRVFDTSVGSIKPTEADLLTYQNSYVFKIENPDWTALNNLFTSTFTGSASDTFYPLDLSDELDLRYRWNQNSPTVTTLKSRFTNLTSTATAVRPYLTAYSFSRNIRQESASTTGLDSAYPKAFNLQQTLNDLVGIIHAEGDTEKYPLSVIQQQRLQFFVQCIYDSFDSDKSRDNYADADELNTDDLVNPNYHTWQYIANLVDYLDDDDDPTIINTNDSAWSTIFDEKLYAISTLTNDRYGTPKPNISNYAFNGDFVYGLERHAVITEITISLRNINQIKDGDGNVTSTDYTYRIDGVEVGNPWKGSVDRPDLVEITVIQDDTGNDGSQTFSFTAVNMAGDFNFTSNDFKQLASADDSQNFTFSDNGSGLGVFTIKAVSYHQNDAPEDILVQKGVVLPTVGIHDIVSIVKETKVTTTSNTEGCWRSLANKAVTVDFETLGEENYSDSGKTTPLAISGFITAGGYATSTIDTFLAPWVSRDISKFTDINIWSEITVNSNPVYVAVVNNLADLAAVPYVGYVKDSTTDEPKGIGDWILLFDEKVRFKFADTTPDLKGSLFRENISKNFKLIDRADDGIDQIIPGIIDPLEEMRLPGLINVNTASSTVLQALHPYMTSTIANTIKNTNFYVSGSNVLSSNMGSTADYLCSTTDTELFLTGVSTANFDVVSPVVKWSRIANLITTRSDTFVAYIYVQLLDAEGNVVTERREMALFDRSLCNEPPLRWNGTAWEPNPAYRPVKVVARQTIN